VEDKRNIVLAMVLAAIILFGWPYVTNYFYPAPPRPAATASATGTGAATPGAIVTGNASMAQGAPGLAPTTPSARANLSIAAARATSPRIPIETPTLRGSINLRGARIDDLVLLRYRQTVERDSPPVQLFAPGGTRAAYFAGVGWSGAGLGAPTADTVWTAPAGARLTPTSPVTLTYDNGAGQQFQITLSVDTNYMFSARQTVVNRGAAPVGVQPYSYLNRIGTSPDVDTWTIHAGLMGVFAGTPEWFDRDDIDEAPNAAMTRSGTGGWLGFTDHFWLGAIIPDQSARVEASMRRGANGIYQADFAGAEALLAPGQQRVATSRIFAGAKETRLLDTYADNGIALFDRATDWGWFIWFVKPMFYLLDWLFRMVGNFGVAIMALTLIIRLVMFPIAQKQFASMAQMRVLQPKLKALQERYVDDKPRLQQEMMNLYKTEKVNPLAGCLPILIQIPIFYALYKALMLTVEMRHQPFVGWIRDLSAPDPANLVTLLGHFGIPWPAILGLGVLAVLLGITMYLQFKLNPPPTDPIQQQVFSIMPWVLMFVMAPFAAGLLLYWITNNILAIGQQWILYRRYPQMKQAMATT
jgi:YidC/Oxa1 family membrane protein insertase